MFNLKLNKKINNLEKILKMLKSIVYTKEPTKLDPNNSFHARIMENVLLIKINKTKRVKRQNRDKNKDSQLQLQELMVKV